jgi:hypothetical protein
MSPERATENVAQHAMTPLREGEEVAMSSTHLSTPVHKYGNVSTKPLEATG